MRIVPLELKHANEFVKRHHRHHQPVYRDKFRCGVVDETGTLRGVVQVARPVARGLDDGNTVEVVRLCTDGYPMACSLLYSRAARAAAALGYSRIVTYILHSESGTSLKAAGWRLDANVRGKSWDCPSRPRQTTAPTCDKQRWVRNLQKGVRL